MKKFIIKLFICVIIVFSFTGCYVLSKKYSYKVNPNDNSSNFSKYMGIYGALTDNYDKDSPIESISIYPINFSNKKTSEKVTETHFQKVLKRQKSANSTIQKVLIRQKSAQTTI